MGLSAAARRPSSVRTRPPSPLPQGVRRTRLEAELDRGRPASLTLVSAGPGFGKTVAVAAWVELGRVEHPFAWLGLDQTDDSPHAFWSDVLAAIRDSGEVPAGSGLNDIIPASVFGSREVDNLLVGLADLRRPLVLILDDFHLITNPDVLDSVGLFLARLPAQLRLVLVTRADPVLPLHRLRIAGQLVEIRSRDLTFTPARGERTVRPGGPRPAGRPGGDAAGPHPGMGGRAAAGGDVAGSGRCGRGGRPRHRQRPGDRRVPDR